MRIIYKINIMENQIQQVNEYMRITQKMLNTNQPSKQNPKNLSQVAKILKNRNEKYGQKPKVSNPQIISLHEKLKKETWVTQIKKTHAEEVESLAELSKPFDYEPFNFNNQQSYLQKHLQFKIHEMMKDKMKEHHEKQDQMKHYISLRLKGYKMEQQLTRTKSAVKIQQLNKKQYHRLVKESVQLHSFQSMLQKLSQSKIHEVWEIFYEQVKQYQYLKSQDFDFPVLGIFLVSLKFLEKKYANNIPAKVDSLNEFLKRNYMSKNQDYQIDKNGMYSWGIAFAYFRAGKMSQFYLKLSEMGQPGVKLRQAFMKFNDQLNNITPEPIEYMDHNIKDIFYQQLIHILKGENMITSLKLIQKNSADLVWLLIKVLGIYSAGSPQAKKTYDEICTQFVQHYKKESFKKLEDFENIIYLGLYSKIITLQEVKKQEQRLTQQDFIHFLIILNEKNEIVDNKKKIRMKLNDQLVQYIQKLMRKDSQYFMYYVLLIPKEYLVDSLVDLFSELQNFKLVQSQLMDTGEKGWDFILRNLAISAKQNEFIQAYNKIIFRLTEQVDDLNEVRWLSQHCRRILGKENMLAEKVLLYGLCRFLVRKAVQQNQSRKVFMEFEETDEIEERVFSELKKQVESKIVSESMRQIMKFLAVYQQLKLNLRAKKVQQLKELTEKQTYTNDIMLLVSNYPNSFKTLINCLQSYNGVYLFLDYLKKYLLAVELLSNRTGNFNSIKESRSRVLLGLKEVRSKKSQLMKENIQIMIRQLENYHD